MSTLYCRHCGAPVGLEEPIPRDAECESCRRDLHACMQCRHYDPAYHNQCRETQADPVEDRARRNFCEYFSFDRQPFRGSKPGGERQAHARARLESLFGSPGGPRPDDRAAEARSKLEGLFGKPNTQKPDGPADAKKRDSDS